MTLPTDRPKKERERETKRNIYGKGTHTHTVSLNMYPSRALKFWLDQLRKHNRLVLGRRRRRSSRVRVWNGIKIKYKDILRERERELDPSQRLTNHLAIRAN